MIYILQILQILLNVAWWIIIVQAILSWLIAFNVINTSNDMVRTIWYALQRMTDPLYRPVRRILPDFGALDLSPMVVLLAIIILDRLVGTAIMQQSYGVVVG
ncbi:YggT family protein [Sphingomonas carotinifaciens]|uniref:YggT family protein n=1 Tax=Sphingomonas carotinifaciens TaxID=1166323 RepID=A0A1G7GMZ1_9SPHN|nr:MULTISPECIES: YggT family protein [Sphingomonas]MBB4086597.1 YggT family protein [Sphingomonas carotinifaciens]MWC42948.1 YggT family protein [Sphingomonas carotinifaciens]SDE89500.1 YggT family protein [Sphingomonas carotinifaciens]